jgi:hypothetical protein
MESRKTFLKKSFQKTYAKSKRRKADWNINRKGLLLRINSRSSFNHYRVYQNNNGLKLEDKLPKHFYYQSFELLNLDNEYTNWLIH